MAPGYLIEPSPLAANQRYSGSARAASSTTMAPSTCSQCGGPLEPGFVTSTNGSGLFWSKEGTSARLRPVGLEVLVPTGYQGTFSANLAGDRCRRCDTILLRLK
jgi:hypothetical protein